MVRIEVKGKVFDSMLLGGGLEPRKLVVHYKTLATDSDGEFEAIADVSAFQPKELCDDKLRDLQGKGIKITIEIE